MLKRITRYTLLIACLLIAEAWGLSVERQVHVGYMRQEIWTASLVAGRLNVMHATAVGDLNIGFGFHMEKALWTNQTLSSRLGLVMPEWETYVEFSTMLIPPNQHVVLPLWTLLTPLLLITAWLWYPIILNRLRRNCGTGFPVKE